jgi:hypothetical protein
VLWITEARSPDVSLLDELLPEAGAIYVMDRGYVDFARLYNFTLGQASFVGMRWFRGLNLHDPVPDHSTLSKLKNERWAESGLFQRLFDQVILQCSEAGWGRKGTSLSTTQGKSAMEEASAKPDGERPAGFVRWSEGFARWRAPGPKERSRCWACSGRRRCVVLRVPACHDLLSRR